MAEMLLLNPRRRRKAKTAKRRKTAKRKTVARRSYAPNPIRTRRRISRKARRAASGRRYRRNPIAVKGMMGQLTDAAVGAAGALGLDVLMGFVPLPDALKTGVAKTAVKGVGAVLLGMAAGAVLPRGMGAKMANGALVVTFHELMRNQLQAAAPTLTLGDTAIPYYPSEMPSPSLGYASPGMVVDSSYLGEYVDGLGEYVQQY